MLHILLTEFREAEAGWIRITKKYGWGVFVNAVG